MPLEKSRWLVVDLGAQDAIALQKNLAHRPGGAPFRVIGMR